MTITSAPVTVAITRRAAAADEAQVLAWVHAGTSLAQTFPGFLGTGWLRPDHDSDEWHMLYRFADAESLHAWEESPQRQWWLRSGAEMIEHTRVERLTGIEGWFDTPTEREWVSGEPEAPAPAPVKAPPRWKQSLLIWMAFFPVNLLATVTLGQLVEEWHVVLRVLVITVCLTPVMTYLVLPRMTKLLSGWLHR